MVKQSDFRSKKQGQGNLPYKGLVLNNRLKLIITYKQRCNITCGIQAVTSSKTD